MSGKEPRYEVRGAGEDDYQHLEGGAWLQAFKDQLAVRIAKVVLAREAAEGSK
jgi:sarcosine oxidase delta subunit